MTLLANKPIGSLHQSYCFIYTVELHFRVLFIYITTFSSESGKDQHFLYVFSERHMPDDDGWWWQKKNTSRLRRNSLVAADVRWCTVFHQPPFDLVDVVPLWSDTSVETILGKPEVLYCRYFNLPLHFCQLTVTSPVSRQISWWMSRRRLFSSRNRAIDASFANLTEKKGRWRRKLCPLISRNTLWK